MKGIKLKLYLLLMCTLCSLFGSVIIGYLGKYDQLRQEKLEIDNQITAESEKSQNLNDELEFNQSDAFVEKIARERLNLVMPDEILFYNDAK